MLIVVCGSVSDPARLHRAAVPLIHDGHLVYVPTANPLLTKQCHDADHRRWLAIADLALIVPKSDGTLGESTAGEMRFAESIGLPVRVHTSVIEAGG